MFNIPGNVAYYRVGAACEAMPRVRNVHTHPHGSQQNTSEHALQHSSVSNILASTHFAVNLLAYHKSRRGKTRLTLSVKTTL